MDPELPTTMTDSASASEYLDAIDEEQVDYFHDAERDQEDQKHSLICEIREELLEQNKTDGDTQDELKVVDGMQKSASLCSDKSKDLASSAESLPTVTSSTAPPVNLDEEDYMNDITWKQQKKHIFILSEAGKPIYSLHGKEDKLATLFGIIQALVSFVQHGQDVITSIHAHGIKFVFMVRNSLMLVAASRTKMSVPQLQMQLSDVYNQILSILTFTHMNKIFEKRKNFDLRRLLAGSERLIHHLLANDSSHKRVTNNVFSFLTNSICVLPLPSAVRSNITSAIQTNCAKIKDLVFAILIADNKLIALVRMKKFSIHPSDLRLIFNLIESSESFKRYENWTPICLPKFDMSGYLHAHVSYLAEDCQACLLLLTVDRDVFFRLSEAKQAITEKLRRTHCLEAINEEMKKRGNNTRLNLTAIGLPELRHFIYKPKATAQLLCSDISPPYATPEEFARLEGIYCDLLHRIHNTARPLKLIYEVKEREVVLAWVTAAYELYVVFEPMVDKSTVIKYVDKLIKFIEKEHDVFFIRNHPTF